MAQHPPIQANHHCQLKQHTQLVTWCTAAWRTSQHRLANQAQTAWRYLPTARRQRSSRPHCFLVTAWRSTPCRQAPLSSDPLTLRLSPNGYQPTARRHTRSLQQLIFLAHSLIWFQLEYYHKHLLFPFIITLGKVPQPYNNQLELLITILLCPYTPTRIPSQFFIPA